MTAAKEDPRLQAAAIVLLLLAAFIWTAATAVGQDTKSVIELQRPAVGETLEVTVPDNSSLVVFFEFNEISASAEGSDLLFHFEDGGQILFREFLTRDIETIEFLIGEVSIGATQVVALVESTEIDPASGEDFPGPAAGEDSSGDGALPNLSGLRHTGRDLLFSLEREREGHPLYSYLLYAGTGGGEREESQRFVSAIKAYVGQVRTADALEKSGAARASINIFYAPLKEIFEDTSPTSMRLHFAQRSAEEQIEILTRLYDHARAEVLMGQMQLRGNGPFIVSVLRPLSDGAIDQGEAFLVQDLSSVPPQLVSLWVDEFKRQVVQEATDSPEHLRRFALNLRTKISVLAEGFAITKSAVAEMFNAPEGDGGE